MRSLSVSRNVAAPVERVWQVATDVDSWTSTISGIEAVERLDDGSSFGVGTRWRETRTLFGKQATEEIAITEVEPGRSYVTEADSAGARYRSVVRLEPSGEGTLLTMEFGAEPRGAAARILAGTIGRLFEGSMRKALGRDLDDIAAAAEASAADAYATDRPPG